MMDTREAVARAICCPWGECLTPSRCLAKVIEARKADAVIAAYLKALAAEGYVVVPREPTEAMVTAAYLYDAADKTYDSRYGSDFEAVYRAMIQAVDNG